MTKCFCTFFKSFLSECLAQITSRQYKTKREMMVAKTVGFADSSEAKLLKTFWKLILLTFGTVTPPANLFTDGDTSWHSHCMEPGDDLEPTCKKTKRLLQQKVSKFTTLKIRPRTSLYTDTNAGTMGNIFKTGMPIQRILLSGELLTVINKNIDLSGIRTKTLVQTTWLVLFIKGTLPTANIISTFTIDIFFDNYIAHL